MLYMKNRKQGEEIMNVKDKLQFINEGYPDVLIADGFDKAIMGIVERSGMNPVVLYNKNKCIDIIIEEGCMTEEEAIEFYYYNIVGSHMGDYTPCFAEIL